MLHQSQFLSINYDTLDVVERLWSWLLFHVKWFRNNSPRSRRSGERGRKPLRFLWFSDPSVFQEHTDVTHLNKPWTSMTQTYWLFDDGCRFLLSGKNEPNAVILRRDAVLEPESGFSLVFRRLWSCLGSWFFTSGGPCGIKNVILE